MAASRRPNWRFTGPLPETVSQSPPSSIPGRDTTTPPLFPSSSIVHLVDHQSADAGHNPKKETEPPSTPKTMLRGRWCVAGNHREIPVEIHLIAKKKKRQRGDKGTDPTNTNPD
ncbi:hypothetical protein HID58_075773 [Brassica napus]|uniref:Uncharacterized protein n=1 Tax=Brassica napus TaxID=3708 RepID=A0ABQ7YNN4_BRANA|nr:hypothetical protein HID58_075773 [Brassica napus]